MTQAAAAPGVCAGCGSQIADSLLACPLCHRLVHGVALRELASRAQAAADQGDAAGAMTAWRDALVLLPPASEQARTISERISRLSAQVDNGTLLAPTPAARDSGSRLRSGAAVFVGLGLLLWKFKFVAMFLLTKAKFLVLGLTKASTFFSMLLAASVYWTIWGWWFALGVVISIYVHEMGHVAALRRFGIAASAPMFIPGLGALVRLHQMPHTRREDARIGLAGPIWGLGGVLAAFAIHLVTGEALFAAIGRFAAWINLFNLLPVWQLDGSRGFAALTRSDRWLLTGVVAVAWAMSAEGLLVLILLVLAGRTWMEEAPVERDTVALAQFAGLVLSLTFLATVGAPDAASALVPAVQESTP